MQAAAETTTVVENELYRIVFSNRGAQVVSWQLKRRPDAPNLTYKDNDGKPLDLVNSQAAKLLGYPMSLYTYDGTTVSIASATRTNQQVTLTTVGNLPSDLTGRSITINGAGDKTFNGTYAVTQTGSEHADLHGCRGEREQHRRNAHHGERSDRRGAEPGDVCGLGDGRAGSALVTDLQVLGWNARGSQDVHVRRDLCAARRCAGDAQWRSGARVAQLAGRLWRPGHARQQYQQAQFDTMRNGKDEHLAPKKISGGDTLNGPFDWAGVSDNFFGAVFLPDNPANCIGRQLYDQMDVAKTARAYRLRQRLAGEGRG